MERREFLALTGKVITVGALMSFMSPGKVLDLAAGENAYDGKDKKRRPHPEDFKQPILKAIALGVNAPNPHNTQSWKFKILNDHEMLLYINEKIMLPETDPPGRQIHMGAGTFMAVFEIGAGMLGYRTVKEYFPEGYTSRDDYGKKPVARLRLEKSKVSANPLALYIYKRQTNRKTYKGPILTQSEFNQLIHAANPQHTEIIFINKPAEIKKYTDLFYEAFKVESESRRRYDETRIWFRYSEKERAQKRDGISIQQMGYSGLMAWFAEKSLDHGNPKKWHDPKNIALSLKGIHKGLDSSKGFILWKTSTNHYLDWIKAGEDYGRFDLACAQQGFYMHPYNQVIQEYDEMKTLRDRFNKMLNIKEGEKIQMITRIGRSTPPYYTYRKHLKDFLI